MEKLFGRRIAGIFLFLLALTFMTPVNAAHYEFSQGGFSGELRLDGKVVHSFTNGQINGSFSGQDTLDKDGNASGDGLIYGLNEEFSELASFSLTFTGNPFFESLFSMNALPFEGSYFQYDIAKNELQTDFYWEGSFSPEFISDSTGDMYEEFIGFSNLKLNVDGATGSLGSGVVYALGMDKDGNFIEGYRDLSITLTSSEKTEVTLVHTPVPGVFYLFAACIPWVISFRKRSPASVD